MEANRLIRFLSLVHPFPPEFARALEAVINQGVYPGGHHLVQAQAASSHLYFLDSGFAATFRYERKKKVVTDFWQPGEIVLSPKSFFDQLATDEIVELAVESGVLSILYRAFNELTQQFPVANSLARSLVVSHHDKCEQRIVDLYTLNAWERYLKLLHAYPHIEMNVSQEMIASYLNITPSSLSRMKTMHH